jgi:hypothetical protein
MNTNPVVRKVRILQVKSPLKIRAPNQRKRVRKLGNNYLERLEAFKAVRLTHKSCSHAHGTIKFWLRDYTVYKKREGTKRLLILDTFSIGSSIQPGGCIQIFAANNFSPCGMAGDALDVKRKKMVTLGFNMIHGNKLYCVHYQPVQGVFCAWIFVLLRVGK